MFTTCSACKAEVCALDLGCACKGMKCSCFHHRTDILDELRRQNVAKRVALGYGSPTHSGTEVFDAFDNETR